jgi:Kunitz/Bovine pancreatic trypsin inhibitor domain
MDRKDGHRRIPRNIAAGAIFLAVFLGPVAMSHGRSMERMEPKPAIAKAIEEGGDAGAERILCEYEQPGKKPEETVGHAEKVEGNPFVFPMNEVIGEMRKRCGLKPERGPCKAIFRKYYYSPESGKCKEFLWGGCDGVVPFESEDACRELCERRIDDGMKKGVKGSDVQAR